MILTGLTMSPGMDAILPWLVDLFGGRQSARTIHFIVASLLVLFVIVHLTMVVLAGPINGVRAMITGKLAIQRRTTMSGILLPKPKLMGRRKFLGIPSPGLA